MKKNSYQTAEQMDNRDRIGLGVWTMHMPERKVAESLVKFANDGNESALRWVKRLEQHGVTDTMVSEVKRLVRSVQVRAHMELDHETGTFDWNYAVPLSRSVSDDNVLFAMMVARLVKSQWADGIKRCEFQECRKFFVGNAKARYCHDNCGAIVRARKIRKNQKYGQAMI